MASFSCFLIGSGTLLQECGEALRLRGHRILGVAAAPGSARQWAERCGLELLDPNGLATALRGIPFDYLFSMAYLEKIADDVLALPRRGAINFHDGPLPRYAGLNAPAWAIIERETQYGACWHRMTSAIDGGAVLKRRSITVAPDETAVSLNTKCLAAGVQSFGELIADLAGGGASEEIQTSGERSYFGRYRRPPAAAVLDWRRPAAELEALVRGLQFGAYPNPLGSPKVLLEGGVFVVTDARAGGASLELTGLSDLRGRAVDMAALANGVRPAAVAADVLERLTEIDALLCRSEGFWTGRLASLSPVAAPLAGVRATGERKHAVIRRPLQLPAALSAGLPAGFAEAAVMAMLVARLQRQPELDFALTDAQWSSRIRGLESMVSGQAACRVRVAQQASFGALVESLGAEIGEFRHRGTWLHDLFAREPVLRVEPVAEGTARLAVSIALGGLASGQAGTAALTLACGEPGLPAELLAAADQYSVAALETLARMFETLAGGVASRGRSCAIGELPLLDERARDEVVRDWNDTALPYSASTLIHHQIAAQAQRTPEAVALVFEDRQITYRELDRRAGQLAGRLAQLGVGPDRLAGVHVGRSIDMAVAVLAVLKAGGAYVPLDPEFPKERIRYMVDDAAVPVILTQQALQATLGETSARVLCVDSEAEGGAPEVAAPAASGDNLAYVIYTSGSTGRPKGVMIRHRNVTAFAAAMDACLGGNPPGTWLAVTSLSFDISVLELLWTLARGYKVVIQGGLQSYFVPEAEASRRPLGFSLFMWGNDDAPGRDKYRLMLEGAKYFDRNGFEAVWTPERHFHAFGGPFPNPSVTGAAIAAVTERIGIRAGSCVSPLHHPARIAEDWAVVDNLSNGRVAIAFASGWQPNDFILRPENHAASKAVMLEQIGQVRRLWRGEKVAFRNPLGQEVPVQTLPRPVQPELPFWVTTAGNPDTYREAGKLGANVLTHLLGQSLDEVAAKVRVYREARAAAGHDPATGRVTLMLHTFVGEDDAAVRELVRAPMKAYLRSSLKLTLGFAWSFPAFKRPGGSARTPQDVDLASLPEAEVDALLDFAFERYFETSGLFGSPSTCAAMAQRCMRAGIDEIACLLDFGVPTELVLGSLPALKEVKDRVNAPIEAGHTLAAGIERHGVTHLQCTPSLARMLLMDGATRAALAHIRCMLVGGEALPAALAQQLQAALGGELRNMYGPTETTVWSASQRITSCSEPLPIGKPIANTQIYITDGFGHPLPAGVPGELVIGGDGVCGGYLNQPALTAERFRPDVFARGAGDALYRSGDLARFLPDGAIEFLGRVDHQVKIRGHRIELGEIERVMLEHPQVGQAAAVLRGAGDAEPQLVGYFVAATSDGKADAADVRRHLALRLPEYMVPGQLVVLDRLPLTPNGKLDRKALPAPGDALAARPFTAPQTATEQVLAGLWQDLLQVERVGSDDNFFALGGHSLLAMQLVSRTLQALSVEVSLREVFSGATLAALAARIDALRQAEPRPRTADAVPWTAPSATGNAREEFRL